MDTLLFALSIFGTPIAIVVFIIRAITKKELKQIKYAGISLIAGITLLVVDIIAFPADTNSSETSIAVTKIASTIEESSKEAPEDTSTVTAAEEVVPDTPEISIQNEEESVIAQTEQSEVPSGEAIDEETRKAAFITTIDISAYEQFNDSYEAYKTDDSFILNIWYDDLSQQIIAARIRDGKTPNEWVQIRDQIEIASLPWYHSMLDQGFDDMHFILNLVSDADHNVVILQIYDGDIVYDFLETDATEPLYVDK